MVIKERLSKNVMKQLLPKKIIISKTNETIIFISNGYQKLIGTVSNDHIKQTVSTITKGPFALKTFSYVSMSLFMYLLLVFCFVILPLLSSVHFLLYFAHCLIHYILYLVHCLCHFRSS
jgi:hypothetical protein